MANNTRRIRGIDNVEEVLRMLNDLSDTEIDLNDGDDTLDSDSDLDVDIADVQSERNVTRASSPEAIDGDVRFDSESSDTGNENVRHTAMPAEHGRGAGRARPRYGGGRARGVRVRDRSRSPVRLPDRNHGFVWEEKVNNRNIRNFAERIGPQRRYAENTTYLEVFEEFLTAEVWQLLVDMTNLNAETKRREHPNKHRGKWESVSHRNEGFYCSCHFIGRNKTSCSWRILAKEEMVLRYTFVQHGYATRPFQSDLEILFVQCG